MTNLQIQLMRLLFLGRHVDTDTANSTIYLKIKRELSADIDSGRVSIEELWKICSDSDKAAFIEGVTILEL